MNHDRLVIAACAVSLLFAPASVSAQYLDPGAGSIMIQVVIAAIVGVSAFAKLYWSRITAFFSKKKTDRSGP